MQYPTDQEGNLAARFPPEKIPWLPNHTPGKKPAMIFNRLSVVTHSLLISSLLAAAISILAPFSRAEDPPSNLAKACEEAGNSSIDDMTYQHPLRDALRYAIRTKSANEIYDLYLSGPPSWAEYSKLPWELAMAPRFAARSAAYRFQYDLAAKIVGLPRKSGILIEILKEAAKRPPRAPYSKASMQFAKSFPRIFKSWRVFGEKKEYQVAPYFCAGYSNFNCIQKMKRIIDFMDSRWNPTYDAAVSMPGLLQRFLTDPTYLPGAARAALKIHERLLRADHGERPQGFVLQDLVSAYRETGLSPQESSIRAWDLLGFYGSRGASIGQMVMQISHSENRALYLSLMLISSGIEALNAASANNAIYGYPPGFRTTCANGKAYHFWLSAYLAHIINQREAVDSTVRAVYLLSILYRFPEGITCNPDSGNKFCLFDIYGSGQNSVRIAFSFDAAGAYWGAGEGALGNGNVDVILRELLEQARKPSPMPMEVWKKAMSYFSAKRGLYYAYMAPLWLQIFKPDAVFNTR